MKKAKYVKWLGRILNVLILIVFVYLIWSITDSISAARKNDEIRNLVVFNQDLNKANAESAGADNEEVIEEKESVIVQTEDGTEILSDYSKLYEVNSDFIGWLSVENTSIAYPIVFTDNNDYYLTRDFFGNEDRHGTVFADYRSDLSEESSNIIMYGHRMRDGSMFGILSEYENKDYFEKHPIIEFDSRTERHSYEIIAVFKSEIFFENDDVFKYYQYTYIGSEEEFESYYNGVKDISLYDTGVTAEYGDHLITLSTCDYSVPDGRLALVAKRIE